MSRKNPQNAGEDNKSTGRKEQRINMSLTDENWEYVKIMSRASGQSMKDFVNGIIAQHREEHQTIYKRTKKIRGQI